MLLKHLKIWHTSQIKLKMTKIKIGYITTPSVSFCLSFLSVFVYFFQFILSQLILRSTSIYILILTSSTVQQTLVSPSSSPAPLLVISQRINHHVAPTSIAKNKEHH